MPTPLTVQPDRDVDRRYARPGFIIWAATAAGVYTQASLDASPSLTWSRDCANESGLNPGSLVFGQGDDAGELWIVNTSGTIKQLVATDGSIISPSADINGNIDHDVALTAAGDGMNSATTINHASAAVEGIDLSVTQLSTPRTSGTVDGLKVTLTSLAGDSGGTYNDLELTCVDGGGSAVHNAVKLGAGFDAAIDGSSCATGEFDLVVPANVAAALVFRSSSLTYWTLKTTTATPNIATSLALTAAGNGYDLDATINHASGAMIALDVSAAQLTTPRTSGTVTGIKSSITSLSGDTAGVDYYAYEAAVTAGEAGADHIAFKVGAGFDAFMDLSSCATGEADVVVGANLADALSIRTDALTYLKLVTTTATPGIAETFTVTATADVHKITSTVNSATGVVSGFHSAITTSTTNHTAGKIAAGTFAVTSLAGDTGGVFACLDLVSTDGGGTTPTHVGIHCASPLDALLYVDANGSGSVVVGAMTAKNPESDTEAGYFSIRVGAARYEVPMYAVV